MEIDAFFLRSGAAINAVMHAEAPLTVTVASNPMTNKYNTKVDVSQLVSYSKYKLCNSRHVTSANSLFPGKRTICVNRNRIK